MPTKKKKFTDREYFPIYPSDPIPPQLYGTKKAHKQENYPVGTVVSTTGTPAYGISKYLVEITHPTLHEVKNWKIGPTEIQAS